VKENVNSSRSISASQKKCNLSNEDDGLDSSEWIPTIASLNVHN